MAALDTAAPFEGTEIVVGFEARARGFGAKGDLSHEAGVETRRRRVFGADASVTQVRVDVSARSVVLEPVVPLGAGREGRRHGHGVGRRRVDDEGGRAQARDEPDVVLGAHVHVVALAVHERESVDDEGLVGVGRPRHDVRAAVRVLAEGVLDRGDARTGVRGARGIEVDARRLVEQVARVHDDAGRGREQGRRVVVAVGDGRGARRVAGRRRDLHAEVLEPFRHRARARNEGARDGARRRGRRNGGGRTVRPFVQGEHFVDREAAARERRREGGRRLVAGRDGGRREGESGGARGRVAHDVARARRRASRFRGGLLREGRVEDVSAVGERDRLDVGVAGGAHGRGADELAARAARILIETGDRALHGRKAAADPHDGLSARVRAGDRGLAGEGRGTVGRVGDAAADVGRSAERAMRGRHGGNVVGRRRDVRADRAAAAVVGDLQASVAAVVRVGGSARVLAARGEDRRAGVA